VTRSGKRKSFLVRLLRWDRFERIEYFDGESTSEIRKNVTALEEDSRGLFVLFCFGVST